MFLGFARISRLYSGTHLSFDARLIRIAITQAAFDAIAATSLLGSVGRSY